MNPDGSNVTKVINGKYPSWSSKSKIAFSSQYMDIRSGKCYGNIYVIKEKETRPTLLLREENKSYMDLSFSPDESKLAFVSMAVNIPVELSKNFPPVIYILDSDGKLTKLAIGIKPRWSPDGQKIVYYWWEEHEKEGKKY